MIDVTSDVAANEDFLLTPARILRGNPHTAAFRRRVGIVANGMECSDGCGASFPTFEPTARIRPAFTQMPRGFSRSIGMCWVSARNLLGNRCRTGGWIRSAVSESQHHARCRKFGLASLRNLDQPPATGAIVIAAPSRS